MIYVYNHIEVLYNNLLERFWFEALPNKVYLHYFCIRYCCLILWNKSSLGGFIIDRFGFKLCMLIGLIP